MNRWFSLANLLTLVWGEDRGFVPKTSHSYGTNTPPLSLLCKCIGEQEGGSLCCGICGEPREQPGEAGPCCAEASQAGADALSGLWISLTEVRGCVGPGGKWDGSESLKKKRRNWRKGVGKARKWQTEGKEQYGIPNCRKRESAGRASSSRTDPLQDSECQAPLYHFPHLPGNQLGQYMWCKYSLKAE